MAEQEWNSISWYWDIFYALLVLLIFSLVARLILEAYGGFIRAWRSN